LLAGRPVIRFRHRDTDDLASKLRTHLSPGGTPLVMADGVVAPTGRVAPVAALLEALSNYVPAFLHLDDAHGFGVLGENGRGTFEQSGHWHHVNGGSSCDGVGLSVCGTLAKALGGYGGVVPGTRAFLDRGRSASHYFDGASAPAAPLAGCTSAALEICLTTPGLRHSLRDNVRRVRSGLRGLGVSVTDEATANIGFVVGASEDMRRVHDGLKADGILLPFVSSYSGLGAQGILRLAVCAGHSEEMISRLLTRLPLHLPS
jgi:8-amino-7-oxononanoate synthase